MRRQIPPTANVCRAVHGVQHLRHGALAVRPRDVDRPIRALGMPQPRAQLLHPRETQADAERIQFVQICQ